MSTRTAGPLLSEPLAPSPEEVCRVVASVCVMLAGVIHLIVAPEHFAASVLVGSFFVLLGVGQLGFALALRASLGVRTLMVAALAHLGVVALYVATRTVDLPFLPVHDHSGGTVKHLPVARGVGNGIPVLPGSHIEDVGFPDLLCLVAELTVIVMLVALLPQRARRPLTSLMLVMGVAALLLRGVGLLA